MVISEMLRIRDFRLLVTGQALSWVGDAFNPIALSVAIVLGGGGARELGAILASAVVARLACTLLGGVWADRVSPHRIMVVADLVRATATGTMAVAFAAGRPSLAVLCVLGAVTAGAGAFFHPAFVSLRPLIVAPEKRQTANATISFLQSASQVAGPVIAGVVVAHSGAVPGFAVNSATFLWSAVCVARIRARADRVAARRSMLAETREGLAEIRSRTWLWSGLLSAGLFHVASGVFIVLVEVTAVRELGGARSLGLIVAAQGVGGIIGGLGAMRVQPRRTLLWGFAALGLFPLFPLAFAWSGTLAPILAFATVAQGGLMFFDVGWQTALQDGIPHERLARVVSWDILISFIALPVGSVLAGPLSEATSTQVVMAGVGTWMLVVGCAPILVRSTRSFTRGVGVAGEGPTASVAGETEPQTSAATASSMGQFG